MSFHSTPTSQPVCEGLKQLFDELVGTPVPLSWDTLASALDQALAQGELYDDRRPTIRFGS